MTQPITYNELELNSKAHDKEMLQLKKHVHLRQTNYPDPERHLRTHTAVVECVDLLLRQEKFIDITRDIFSRCKEILGATAGFVALVEQSGKCLEVLHLDTGGMLCTVNADSPMPIRGLRKETLQKKTTLYCNHFSRSKWFKFLPKGHVQLNNVLLSPIVVGQTSAGLLGFSNKPGDFDEDDSCIAASFAKLAALALSHSKAWQMLQKKPGWH